METVARIRPVTEEELDGLPDDGCRHELQGGVLFSEPVPRLGHGRLQVRISRMLASHAESHGLGEVLGEAGYTLAKNPDTVRGPDVSFVSRARWEVLENEDRFFPGAPDLAVEILSPSNRRAEVHGKVADYLAADARLVWVVDPESKSVTRYRTLLAPRRLTASDMLEGEDVLPGFAIAVESLFQP